MECLYRGCNVTSWRFIWINIRTEWTPIFHKFDEEQSITTSVCLIGHLLTHGRNVCSCNCKIRLQRIWNISQMLTNLEKLLIKNLIGPVLNKTHVFILWDSLSFSQKSCWSWLVKITTIFPWSFPRGPHVWAGWILTNNNPYWSF